MQSLTLDVLLTNVPNWDKFKDWPSWKFLNFPFTAFSVSNSIRHLGCFAHREQRIFLTELLSTPPMLPCSHPATRPECRLPSWSAPPKLLAVPLVKHEAMNGKECTPEFDSIYSFKLRFKVKLQVCVISSVSLVFKFRDVVLFGTSPSPLPRWTPRSTGQSAASRQERLGSYYLVSVTEGSPFHGRVLC